MRAAHEGTPIGSLGLRAHRERPIRIKPVHEIYGHLDRRRRGGQKDVAGALRPGPAVRAWVGAGPVFPDGARAPTPCG
jgi:hypothetical protein